MQHDGLLISTDTIHVNIRRCVSLLTIICNRNNNMFNIISDYQEKKSAKYAVCFSSHDAITSTHHRCAAPACEKPSIPLGPVCVISMYRYVLHRRQYKASLKPQHHKGQRSEFGSIAFDFPATSLEGKLHVVLLLDKYPENTKLCRMRCYFQTMGFLCVMNSTSGVSHLS